MLLPLLRKKLWKMLVRHSTLLLTLLRKPPPTLLTPLPLQSTKPLKSLKAQWMTLLKPSKTLLKQPKSSHRNRLWLKAA